jgi:hypothetical protein
MKDAPARGTDRHQRLDYPSTSYGPWTGVFYPFKQGQAIPGQKRKFDELVDIGDLRRSKAWTGARSGDTLRGMDSPSAGASSNAPCDRRLLDLDRTSRPLRTTCGFSGSSAGGRRAGLV